MTTPAAFTLPAGALDDLGTSPDGAGDDRPVAVISWPSVPVEIVRAAGLRPVLMRGGTTSTPRADAYLEAGVFPSRLRQLVDAAIDGRLSRAACVILPRTSDADYKTFLYLRELIRRGALPTSLRVVLFDLLQSRGAHVREYNVARTRALFDTLRAIVDRPASLEDVRAAIQAANAARAAVRRLLALRAGVPRVKGGEVLPVVRSFWRLAPEKYVALAAAAIDVLASRTALSGVRVLIDGAPMDGTMLHAAVESLDAIVVSEVGPWGSGAAGEDVACDSDPMAALAETYRYHPCGPRTTPYRPSAAQTVEDIDAVLVALPPDDTAFGWDYPGLRRRLDARGLPHACFVGDPFEPIAAADRARLATLVASATSRVETRRG